MSLRMGRWASSSAVTLAVRAASDSVGVVDGDPRSTTYTPALRTVCGRPVILRCTLTREGESEGDDGDDDAETLPPLPPLGVC